MGKAEIVARDLERTEARGLLGPRGAIGEVHLRIPPEPGRLGEREEPDAADADQVLTVEAGLGEDRDRGGQDLSRPFRPRRRDRDRVARAGVPLDERARRSPVERGREPAGEAGLREDGPGRDHRDERDEEERGGPLRRRAVRPEPRELPPPTPETIADLRSGPLPRERGRAASQPRELAHVFARRIFRSLFSRQKVQRSISGLAGRPCDHEGCIAHLAS